MSVAARDNNWRPEHSTAGDEVPDQENKAHRGAPRIEEEILFSPGRRRHHVQLHQRKPKGTKEAGKESTSPPSPTSISDRMKNSSGNPGLLANLPKLADNLRRTPIHPIPSSHRRRSGRRRRESIISALERGSPLFASRGDCSEGKRERTDRELPNIVVDRP